MHQKIPSSFPNDGRRRFLQRMLGATGVVAAGPALWGCGNGASPRSALTTRPVSGVSNIPNLSGKLIETAVVNDPQTRVRIPQGFTVREVARTGRPAVSGGDYLWHAEPDGGAVFPMPDGGWVYVSNAEIGAPRRGGVGALRFDVEGELIDSYPICKGTTNNCAGGPTPWGTWLSCEEMAFGLVYECDPSGEQLAVPVPALGMFQHEAAAVDPLHRHIYLTEDEPDGNLYRFVPAHYPDGGRAKLDAGELQVAIVDGDDVFATRSVRWAAVPIPVPDLSGNDAASAEPATRYQVQGAATFNGGEGCWFHDGVVYFTSKGDNRIWAFDTNDATLDVVYDRDRDRGFDPAIADVDNLTVSAGGDLIVAEDGAEMRLVVVGEGVKPYELLNILGHRGSEITGPAFSPDGSRLYFSSQNGIAGNHADGRTYEMRGPFFLA